MIKINIPKEKMEEIEKLHWKWFKEKKKIEAIYMEQLKLSETELKGLIIGKRKKLNEYIEKFGSCECSKLDKIIKEKNKEFIKECELKKLEGKYTNFRKHKDEWNGVRLIEKLGLTTCPYCNRNYISIIKDNEKGSVKATAQLDHFYPKEKYPYLALSLYNLIPVCSTCNQIKSSDESEMIYPYDEEFGENAKFTIALKGEEVKEEYNVDVLLGMSDDFKIDFDIKEEKSKLKEKIINSIKTFKLDKIYSQNHKDYVRELIKKAIIYNESRITELYSQYGELFDSREEVVNMIVSNYISEEEIGKRPLGKLTRDICEELGIDIK